MKLIAYIGGFILLVLVLNKWIPPSPPEYDSIVIPAEATSPSGEHPPYNWERLNKRDKEEALQTQLNDMENSLNQIKRDQQYQQFYK